MDDKHCSKPDRHVPGLQCGYPLPCPYHTVIIDTTVDSIHFPSEIRQTSRLRKRLAQILDIFTGRDSN